MSAESRVITMKFDNQTFAQKAQQTLDLLARLRQSLDFSKNKKGVQDFQKAADGFNLNGMNTHIQGASAKFLALSTVAITALSNIVNKAVDAGTRIVKALTLEPIMDGFREYETNMNSIQTILANTQAAGSTLDDVNHALQELNHYSDQTIYNFSEMARNIGTFTAAGVDLKTATGSIKGIANLAALSGSNSQQASTAMYQLSQAISAGRVSLMDWNSVVNAGMGGTVFQRALAQTAVAMGKIDESALSLEGAMQNVKINGMSFRESISADTEGGGWLTSDVLTNTLNQFAGDLTDAELAAQGFNEAQIEAIRKTAATAKSAATEVKTITQLFGTLKESAASGWMQSFQTIFGDFEEAKVTLTAVNNVLGGMIQRSADARNGILDAWKAGGGRNNLIQSIANGFNAVMAVVNVFRGAMREIIPPVTGGQLAALTSHLMVFTRELMPSAETLVLLSRTFRGFFAAISIGWQIVKGLAGVILDLLGNLEGTGTGILEFTANIGDFLVGLDAAMKNGEGLNEFFDGLSDKLQKPIDAFKKLAGAIGAFFEQLGLSSVETVNAQFGQMGERLNPLVGIMGKIGTVADFLGNAFMRLADWVAPAIEKLTEGIKNMGSEIADKLGADSFDKVLDLINTALLGAITGMVMKFFAGGMSVDVGGGFLSTLSDTFGQLNETLGAMQTNLQAKTLLTIAAAVGILTASMVALSLIDSEGLTRALSAMAVGMAQLMGAMAVLIKIGGAAGFIQIPMIATAFISLATAVLILSTAVRVLSSLSWEELAVGMAGIGGALGLMVGAAVLLSKFAGPGLVAAGAGMILMATAIRILANSVLVFAAMEWEELNRGMIGVAAALAIVTAAAYKLPPNLPATGLGLMLVAVAMRILVGAVKSFADMSWEELNRGMIGLGAALVIIAGAMALMPNLPLQAVGLLILSAAMQVLANVLQDLATMSWEDFGKSMAVLAGALAILAAGMYAMTFGVAGIPGILAAAAALAIIAPVLVTLGGLTWEEIGKGLVAIAGAFVVVGLAGLLLTPVIPALLGLGAAILLLGAGAALAGLGVLAFATAFTLLGAVTAVGTAAIVGFVRAIIALIPEAMVGLANGIIAFAAVIGTAGPQLTAAFTTLLISLLDAIIKIAPKIGEAMLVLIDVILDILVEAVPNIVEKTYVLISALLAVMAKQVGPIAKRGTDLIIAFMNAIAAQAPRLADAAFKALITFMDGLTRAINNNSARLRQSGKDLAMAIIDGLTGGLGSGIGRVVEKAKEVAQKALNAAKNLLGIRSPSREFFKIGMYSDQGMAKGLEAYSSVVEGSAAGVGSSALTAMKESLRNMNGVVMSEMNTSPVISPVIDLTEVRKGAARLNDMIDAAPVAAVSYAQAAEVARSNAGVAPTETPAPTVVHKEVKVEQNNYSPKAISAVDTYRHTKNLLALTAKSLEGDD